MKQLFILVALAALVFLCNPASAQSTDAVLTGNVLDPAGASVPGATVTALDVKTGVPTVVTSTGAGVYLFPALPPGDYRVTAEKTGFRKLVLTSQVLRTSDHVTLNMTLEIGAIAESIEVKADTEAVNYLTATQGGLVNSQRVQDLPVASRNVMDLVLTQPGLVSTSNGANINGARADMVNITMDGVNIMDNAITESLGNVMINSTTDRIEEVRVTTSPADAEYGRGSGQIQLISRSGGNKLHAAVYDYAHNTRLNANSWSNNRNGVPKNVLVENQPGIWFSGPVRKNKTFFFALFEGDFNRTKNSVTVTTLTDTARQGIFRFYPGVQNANANGSNPVVDLNGNPVTPRGATGSLQSVSVFGLDPNRPAADPTGIVTKQILSLLPSPNNFLAAGDGLNTAAYLWRRGASNDTYSETFRVDQNFSEAQRLTVSYSGDYNTEPNNSDAQPLPTSPAGGYQQHDLVGSVALTSMPRPNLVNEARIGIQRGNIQFLAPWTIAGKSILPSLNNVPYLLSPPLVTAPIGTVTSEDPQGRRSPVYQYSDRVSWLRGRHAIKAGAELRFVSENEFVSFNVVPRVTLGAGNIAVQGISTISGIGANSTNAQSLLNLLAGSIGSYTQQFYSPGGANPQFVPGQDYQHTWRTREGDAFVQDDIKVRSNLTINIGLRWEYYGVPYEAGGRAVGLVGGSQSIFGISGTTFGALFNPGVTPGSLTQLQLVGKNSPHPEQQIWAPNYRNFAPALGLSWALPYKWLGANKTVLRAGYGIAFERDPLVLVDQLFGLSAPGLGNPVTLTPTNYQNLANASSALPLTPTTTPLALVPINDSNGTTTVLAADGGLKTPYIQNWNISLGREIANGLVVDVRYVGSKGTKLFRGMNLNEENVFENGILNAFQITDAGGSAPLFNQIFKGLNVSGAGVVDGTTITGSDAVRKNSTMQAYLLTNNVGGFAQYLAYTTNYTGTRGGLIKNGGLPANFITVNPQFGSAYLIGNHSNSTYNSVQVEVNKRFGHGFQVQASYVRSKALGEYDGNAQAENSNFITLRNFHLDKRLISFDTPNVWRTSGVWELPFGPQRKLLGSSHGVLAHIVEKWQTAVIFNKLSGAPTVFGNSAGDTFNAYGNTNNTGMATDVAFGPLPKGSVQKVGNNVVYFTGLTQVPDPSIQNMPASLRSLSSLYAIQGPNGNTILQNPALGTIGGLSLTDNYRGLGSFTLNMQLSKSIVLSSEHNVTMKVRADAINLLNRPIWGTPNLNIDSTSFGQITSASGTRNVVLGARIEF